MHMWKAWRAEHVFIGIRFRSGLVLVECVMKAKAEWRKTTVLKLASQKRAEVLTCTEYDIPHMEAVYLPKAVAMEMEELLGLIIDQNRIVYKRLW